METIQVIWFVCLASAAIGQTTEELLKTIERFLKPNHGDRVRRDELRQRINNAEKECNEGICKDLREKLGNSVQYNRITRLMILYDDCMEECTAKEQRSLDLLHELELKSECWSRFRSTKKTMGLAEAESLWAKIRGQLQLLLAEQQKLDRIERILKPSEVDYRLRHELKKRITKTEEMCATVECKTLMVKPAKGNLTLTKMRAKYNKCVNRCKAKERHSYDKFNELKKKGDYWKNFNGLRKGKTVGRALTYWTKIRNEFKVMVKEQLQLEKIERILKPSATDENMRKELYDRINETESECKRQVQETLVIEIQVKMDDQCTENNTIAKKKTNAYRLLKEIQRKENYWTKFERVMNRASLRAALVYWRNIRNNFKQLEKEEHKYEAALASLKLTKEELKLKEKLEAKIREQNKNCTMGECADFRTAILKAEKIADQDSAADQFVKCLKTCKREVIGEIERLNELQEKNDRYKVMKNIREQVSVIAALSRYEKDELSSSE